MGRVRCFNGLWPTTLVWQDARPIQGPSGLGVFPQVLLLSSLRSSLRSSLPSGFGGGGGGSQTVVQVSCCERRSARFPPELRVWTSHIHPFGAPSASRTRSFLFTFVHKPHCSSPRQKKDSRLATRELTLRSFTPTRAVLPTRPRRTASSTWPRRWRGRGGAGGRGGGCA